jgi:hypothetical protein
MATNLTGDYRRVWQKSVICSHPTTPLKGQPVRVGLETGIAITNEATTAYDLSGNASGYTTVFVGPFRAKLSCKGVNDSGNSAIADGDSLFYVDADVNDGTGFLSKKSSGYFYGFARGAVNSGSTTTIEVDHQGTPGSGTLATGSIGTSNLAANAVTAAKLTSTLGTGYIPLPLAQARIIASNDIAAKGTPDGGLVSLDTDPTFKRINGATDKNLRIAWAATSVIPITWSFAYPPDLDDTAAVLVHLLLGMAGATDTPTVAVNYFEGVGDTNAGGNTAALAATVADKTRTIAASDVGPYPISASVELVPAAHGTDAIYLYGAWIEYTRK